MSTGESPVIPADPATGRRGRGKIVALAIVAVVIVASVSVVGFLILSAPPTSPPPSALDHVSISASRTMIDQRETIVATAIAIDTKGVDQSQNATFAFSASPTSRVQLSSGSQVNRMSAVALTSGLVSIAAQATWRNVTKQAQVNVTINPLHYEATASNSTPTTGDPVNITVRVLHGDSSVATSYLGEVAFTSDDPLATLPATTAFTSSDAGVHVFGGVIIRKAGAVQITASDTLASIAGSVVLTGKRPLHAPVASFAATRDLMHVDVDASSSTDPDNNIANYTWLWGDGASTGPQTTTLASHDYTTAGRYTIALEVTDATNLSDYAFRIVTVAPSTIDYSYYDFFNVPYADFWDLRSQNYYELPIGTNCFNATAVAQGVCVPTNQSIPNVETYPYTDWLSDSAPGTASSFPSIYAPYRWHATGLNVPGYNLSEPVFLPVMNYGAPPGNLLRFNWYMQYLNQTNGNQTSFDCASNFGYGVNDGYILRSDISLTMDLQESKRIFGVIANTPAQANAWWQTNTDPSCVYENATEMKLEAWFVSMGGSAAKPGKYDIENGYQWYYQPFATNITAKVDADGTTHIWITHVAYGTEVLLARFFYWGNASYVANVFNSAAARGWWGMENAWFEDLRFSGQLNAATFNFNLTTVEQYHLQNICGPGTDSLYNHNGDVSEWIWGPWLDDYVTNFSAGHPYSEMERYPTQKYVHCTPGATGTPDATAGTYGKALGYDYLPITWNLKAGETWHFQFPTGNVVFYDPNLTPQGANPVSGDYKSSLAPMKLDIVLPSGYGSYNASANTYDVTGPATTGGPDGTPGNYALDPWPQLTFLPAPTAGLAQVTALGASGGIELQKTAEAGLPSSAERVGSAISLWEILIAADLVRRIERIDEVAE